MSSTNIVKAQQAVASVIEFPIAVNKIANEVAGASFGPWKIDVHCNYDDDCKKEHYWDPVHFSTESLVNALHRSEQYSKTFFPKFQPILDWVQDTLPQFSKTFNGSTKQILKIWSAAKTEKQLSSIQRITLENKNPTAHEMAAITFI